MYQVSERLDRVISGSGRTFYARINGIQEKIKKIKITSMSVPDNYIYIGSAISSKVEVYMYTKSSEFAEGLEITLEIGAYVDDVIEWVPMGVFTISKSQKDRSLLTFTAYDKIQSKLGTTYSSKVTYPAESREFLKDISDQTGVKFDTESLEENFVIDKITSIDDQSGEKVLKNPFDGFTMQQVVGYIAQLHGKFAVCDRSGNVVFKWYQKVNILSDSNRILDQNVLAIRDQMGSALYDSKIDYGDEGKIQDSVGNFLLDQGGFFIYDTLKYYASAQTYIVKTNRYFDDLIRSSAKCEIEGIGCNTENEYFESGGIANIVMSNPVMKQEWLDNLFESVKGFNFYPASFSFMGDPRLDVGDIIVVIDATGNPINVPVMSHTLTYDGGLLSSVASYGERENSAEGPTAIAVQQMRNDILTLQEITAQKATFVQLSAVDAKVTNLQASTITADKANVLYARLDKTNIEMGWITTAMIGNAQITDAKIDSLTASKITSGTIDASDINVINLNAANITVGKIIWQQLSDDINSSITDSANKANNALSTASTALQTADSKNTAFYQASQPAIAGRKQNDIWYDTGNGNAMYYFNGSTWVKKVFGNNALDNLSASKITTGTLDAAKVTLINLDAGSITTGTITGLDALFNRSFTVKSQYSDTESFIIEANENNIIIGTRDKNMGYTLKDNSVIFSKGGVSVQAGRGNLTLDSQDDITIHSDIGEIVLYANGTEENDVPIYARNDLRAFKVHHDGNTTLKSNFENGVEIGILKLGDMSTVLKVPLASNVQSGLITSTEKAKINTDYLPLAGGTLKSSNVDVLGLNCTSGTMSTLRFYGNGTRLGSIGFNGQNSKAYRWNASGSAYKLLDEDDLKDSGWVNITVSSGLSVVTWIGAKVRKIGNEVNLVLGVTGVTKAFLTIATIPEGYRPKGELNVAARYTDMIDSAVAIEASGSINILNRTSGKAYEAKDAVSFSTTYFV